MNIAGSGSLPGGEYLEAINISGSGKITGNVSCTAFNVSGSGKVEGNLICSGDVRISGNGIVKGNAEANEVTSSGNGKINGVLQCDKLSSSGNFEVRSIATTSLHSSGMFKSDEDVSAEDAVFRGAVNVGGLINAEKLDVVFDIGSAANSIGGSMIKIRRKGFVAGLFAKLLGQKSNARFHVNGSIEGDVIDVEHVAADSVVGREVKIGPGCQIGQVIYVGTVEISPEAQVGNCTQGL